MTRGDDSKYFLDAITAALSLMAFVVSLVTVLYLGAVSATLRDVKNEQDRRTQRVYSQDEVLSRLDALEQAVEELRGGD